MIVGDLIKNFEGAYGTIVRLTLNNNIPHVAMELDIYEDGELSEHTYFNKEQAIAIAKAILEELQ